MTDVVNLYLLRITFYAQLAATTSLDYDQLYVTNEIDVLDGQGDPNDPDLIFLGNWNWQILTLHNVHYKSNLPEIRCSELLTSTFRSVTTLNIWDCKVEGELVKLLNLFPNLKNLSIEGGVIDFASIWNPNSFLHKLSTLRLVFPLDTIDLNFGLFEQFIVGLLKLGIRPPWNTLSVNFHLHKWSKLVELEPLFFTQIVMIGFSNLGEFTERQDIEHLGIESSIDINVTEDFCEGFHSIDTLHLKCDGAITIDPECFEVLANSHVKRRMRAVIFESRNDIPKHIIESCKKMIEKYFFVNKLEMNRKVIELNKIAMRESYTI